MESENTKQAVSQIRMIPWGHNIAIIQKMQKHRRSNILCSKYTKKMVLVEMYLFIK